jgi:hypothetical protein
MFENAVVYLAPVFGIACLVGVACRQPPPAGTPTGTPTASELPLFPADDPQAWTCGDAAEVDAEQIQAWCAEHQERGAPAELPPPAPISDPAAKNAYDEQLRAFLRGQEYRELGWVADRRWRLTGPYVGPLGAGKSYGVHPAVRIWYSPEVVDWMCAGREGEPADGAMIVKEMHAIDARELGIDPSAECMRIDAEPETIEPESWTVMVRASQATHDGWYWANPTAKGEGNPPILDRSGVTSPEFFAGDKQRNDAWYPTGDLFGAYGTLASAVTPYSEFGAYCVNCHASAESLATFSSLDNVIGEGLRYRHFSAPDPARAEDTRSSGAEHGDSPVRSEGKPSWGFSQPLESPAAGWAGFFGALGPTEFADAVELRLPAETYDQRTADPDAPATFLSSSQCIGCHDATVSNDSTPNMLWLDEHGGKEIDISPYAEWRASPMGLAGRDPIFFAQLQSETNNLGALQACIENTCLHCHGVMGQRSFAADTGPDSDACKDLFGVEPPPGVPFGEPFRLAQVSEWGGEGGDPSLAKYGALARDGISCTVCHRISDEGLGSEATSTGNYLTGPADELVGPYQDEDIVAKPMEHAIGVTPKYGEQIESSELCGSCHDILLPVLSNEGEPMVAGKVDGKKLYFSYEQSTHLEWQNSAYAEMGPDYRSCQDCHMPRWYPASDGSREAITGVEIANIESDAFAPTTFRLPDEDIALRERDRYSRHALHGLNIFQNQLAQQFPLLLGLRQLDFMGSTQPSSQPGLVTAAQSIVDMARHDTATVEIREVELDRETGMLELTLVVHNFAGHNLPSGVGFRRAFVELLVRGEGGELLWASGRTNELGVILSGTSDEPLASEFGRRDSTAFQPHHQEIRSGAQVQIYQELVLDSDGHLTTSFLRRAKVVKDNRLRPRGFDPAAYADHESAYVRLIAQEYAHLPSGSDPDYRDRERTGADELRYRLDLGPEQAGVITEIRARLYSQSIPPSYLQQRFDDAEVGLGETREIRRLYYMTSHLRADESTPIPGWKLLLAGDCKTAAGQPCEDGGSI